MIVASGTMDYKPTLDEQMVFAAMALLDNAIASNEPIHTHDLADRIVGELMELQVVDEYEREKTVRADGEAGA